MACSIISMEVVEKGLRWLLLDGRRSHCNFYRKEGCRSSSPVPAGSSNNAATTDKDTKVPASYFLLIVLKCPQGFLELLSLVVLFWIMSSICCPDCCHFFTLRGDVPLTPSSAREVEVQLLVKVNSYSSLHRKSPLGSSSKVIGQG